MARIESWVLFSGLTLLAWGFWAFFPKLAIAHIHPRSALVWDVVGGALVGIGMLFFLRFRPETQPAGILFGILTGIAGLLGALFFLFAVRVGKAAVVVTMTALYPLVTILLSFLLLHETIALRQGVGIILALAAMVLMAA